MAPGDVKLGYAPVPRAPSQIADLVGGCSPHPPPAEPPARTRLPALLGQGLGRCTRLLALPGHSPTSPIPAHLGPSTAPAAPPLEAPSPGHPGARLRRRGSGPWPPPPPATPCSSCFAFQTPPVPSHPFTSSPPSHPVPSSFSTGRRAPSAPAPESRSRVPPPPRPGPGLSPTSFSARPSPGSFSPPLPASLRLHSFSRAGSRPSKPPPVPPSPPRAPPSPSPPPPPPADSSAPSQYQLRASYS